MRRSLCTLCLLGVVGCASSPAVQTGSIAGLAPMLSVERFLQAANSGDLEAMARIFGTAEGSIADRSRSSFACGFKRIGSWIGLGERCLSRQEIELRMNAIAVILQHDDYAVRAEAAVPGRSRPTTRISVDIERGAEQWDGVPFVVVQTSDGRWLVEEIGLELMTAARPSVLDELPKYAARAPRMDESGQVTTSSRAGLDVDQLETLFVKDGQLRSDVWDAIRDVM